MSDTSFVNLVTLTDADWFNDVNRLHYTIFGGPANIAAVIAALNLGGLPLPRGHIDGFTISNNGVDATNDIDIAAGSANDGTNAVNISRASAITKRLDASWAVGTNQGGLDTGSIANVTYHVYVIKRSDTGVVDVLFSADAVAPTMPANYDYKRRVGSFRRVAGAILPFLQDGDWFQYETPIADVLASGPGDIAWTRAMTVPEGIRVRWRGAIRLSASDLVLLSDLGGADVACDGTAFTLSTNGVEGGMAECMTDTNAQIRTRMNDGALTVLRMNTHGWVDARGKDS